MDSQFVALLRSSRLFLKTLKVTLARFHLNIVGADCSLQTIKLEFRDCRSEVNKDLCARAVLFGNNKVQLIHMYLYREHLITHSILLPAKRL